MTNRTEPAMQDCRRMVRSLVFCYLGVLLFSACALGALHYFFADVEIAGTRWFNLDKERNLPTWFSGCLFFLFGASAAIAFYFEHRGNAGRAEPLFRLPVLWLGVAMVGFGMSIDEITILHENLFWREVRQTSHELGGAWQYMTQWQILLSPVILLCFGYMAVFFNNRFAASRGARWSAAGGLGSWLLALSIEGIRQTFKADSAASYMISVLAEEFLEMSGAILLFGAIVMYIIDIALALTAERQRRLAAGARFLSRQTLAVLAVLLVLFAGAASLIYGLAKRQAAASAAVPKLFERALRERPDGGAPAPPFAGTIVDGVSDVPIPVNTIPDALRILADWLGGEAAELPQLPAALEQDTATRVVLISASNGEAHATIGTGRAAGLANAMRAALTAVAATPQKWDRQLWLKLDIVNQVGPLAEVSQRSQVGFERSLFGLAFPSSYNLALLPEELNAHSLISDGGELRLDKIETYRSRFRPEAKTPLAIAMPMPVQTFACTSWFFDGRNPVQLFRGNRSSYQLSPASALQAATAAGGYLQRALQADGTLIDRYFAKANARRSDFSAAEHAGVLRAMLELQAEIRSPALAADIGRLLSAIAARITPWPEPGSSTAVIADGGGIAISDIALTIIALAEVIRDDGKSPYRASVQQLCAFLASQQQEDGGFIAMRPLATGIPRLRSTQGAHVSQAALAFLLWQELDTNADWGARAARAVDFQIANDDSNATQGAVIFDCWQLAALAALQKHAANPRYEARIRQLIEPVVNMQHPRTADPDYLGGYGVPPQTGATATRCRALVTAYPLLQGIPDAAFAEQVLAAAQRAAVFLLHAQFTPENVLYVVDPAFCLGGFREDLRDYTVRVEYGQHSVLALLALRRIMIDRGLSVPSLEP